VIKGRVINVQCVAKD